MQQRPLFTRNANALFQLNGSTWVVSILDNGSRPILLGYSNGIYLGFVISLYNSDKILKSSDNGATWTEIVSTPYMYDISNLFTANGILFGNNNSGAFFNYNSSDGSWSRFIIAGYNFGGTVTNGSVGNVYSIAFGAGNKYYIGTNGGVWSSSDNGTTWLQHHIGLPITNTLPGYKTVKDLYISGNSIIAATTAGIYRSTDQANTWTQVSTLVCNDLHKYGSYLYATGNGVFRSNDNGLTWSAFAGATSGGPFSYITGAGGKLFTSTDASSTPGNTVYADTLATSFSSLTTNIGGAYGYGDFLFLSKFYINTALSLTNQVDMTDNLPCYYASVALGCIETYLSRNVVYGDNLWLGTSGFSTWYRSIGDFGFPVTATNIENEESAIALYPNPATNNFTVQNAKQNSVISIYNLQGSKVFTKKLQEKTDNINIEQLSNGIYFYQVLSIDGNVMGQGKVVKN